MNAIRFIRRLRIHTAALVFFAGLAFIALYAPLFHAATHTGSDFPTDYAMTNWNFWWIRHALTTPGLNVYLSDYVLFPAQNNFGYHTLNLFWFPLWALLEPFTGTLIATNSLFVVSMTLAGYCGWLLLRREGVASALALAGGAIFELTPAVLLSVMVSHINYVSIFWYPLHLLLWSQVARCALRGRSGILWAILQGAAFYAMMLTDLQHSLFLSMLLAPYGLLTLVETRTWTGRLRLALLGGLALAVMLALLWFAGPLPYILRFDTSSLAPQPIENASGIPFPDGYFSRFQVWERRVSLGAFALPGVIVSLLAGAALLRGRIRDRRRWFWLALIIAPLLLSLGPSVMIGGATFATPYVWFHELFSGMFRVPARFAPVIVLAALLFIGRTWMPALPRRAAWRVWIGVGLTLLAAGEVILYGQMPLQPVARHYTFYEAMRAETYDYVVVEVPVAGGSGEAWVGELRAMETQFYGVIHQKKMLNGSVARAPLDDFWHWLTDDPMLSWLGQRRFLEPELVEQQLRKRIFDYPIGYIVIHRDLVGRDAVANQEIIGYFNSLPDLLCPVWVEDDAVVFRSAWHPTGCPARTPPEIEPDVYQVDVGAADDVFYLGWGWHYPEMVGGLNARWTGQLPQAALYVDLPPGAYTLEITAQSFYRQRRLEARVSGEPVGVQPVPLDGLAPLRFVIPADLVGDGQHIDIELIYDGVDSPLDVGMGDDERRLALLIDTVRFIRR